MITRTAIILPLTVLLTACATPPPASHDHHPDLGILWVRSAAEWEALALQAYGAATDDLPGFLADTSWSALPDQDDAADLPPAIIVDVDETMVSNVLFQMSFEPPFANWKLDEWNEDNPSLAVPGAPEFINFARDQGVAVFYVTNRPCAPQEGVADPCPQEQITIDDLNESGMPADEEHVLLSEEQPSWTDEKKVRRDLIAQDYRVLMLVGDDLGDFIPCVRARAVAPCTEPATAEERRRRTRAHTGMWGNGWYVLPNPMHGSWTSAK
jgi:5'-nucleotidase (lipoprotein e(P4) family)